MEITLGMKKNSGIGRRSAKKAVSPTNPVDRVKKFASAAAASAASLAPIALSSAETVKKAVEKAAKCAAKSAQAAVRGMNNEKLARAAVITASTAAAVTAVYTLTGGYLLYRFAVVRDKSGRRQRNAWLPPETHGGAKHKKKYEDSPEYDMKREGEEYIREHAKKTVRIKSYDGLTLVGHIIEADEAKPRGVFLMLHGYRSSGVGDFSCAAKMIHDAGFACLIVDERACGYSEGEKIGFGVTERYDAVRWASFAEKRWGGIPIVVDGVSMGATTALLGGEVGYPDSVKAIIADCGYTTPAAICKKTLFDWFGLPPFPVYYGARLWIRALAGYDIEECDTRDAIRATAKKGIPVLIAHGEDDGFVPYKMGEETYRAALEVDPDSVELFSVKGADHGQSFIVDRDGYTTAIDRLMRKAGIGGFAKSV